jgi:hypothetical protein
MGTLRTAAIPIEHVISEITAFPLASEAAFRLCTTDMQHDLRLGTNRTGDLWRKAERHIAGSCPSFSLDELVAMRDRIWFANNGQIVPRTSLRSYLRSVAKNNLEVRGAAAVPKVSESQVVGDHSADAELAKSRRAWRWLTFALPPDLVLAALHAGNCRPDQVGMVSPCVSQCLADHGFAETHLHVGAAIHFPFLWVATLWSLSDTRFSANAFESPGADFDDGRDFAIWLLRAAVARYLLAAFLAYRRVGGSAAGSFAQYLTGTAYPQHGSIQGQAGVLLVDLALRELIAGNLHKAGPSFAQLRAEYAAMTGAAAQPFPASASLVPLADPIARLLVPLGLATTNVEVEFVAQGLEYLQTDDDDAFARLFWQTVRVRCLYYRHLIQRPMTPGLQWFVRTYARIKAGRGPLKTPVLVTSAADLSGISQGLRSLEVRTSPDASLECMLAEVTQAVAAFDTHPQRQPASEFGIVCHLAKLRAGGADDGRNDPHWANSNADPGANPTGYRYAKYYAKKRNEILGLARLLLNFPRSLEVVRGIDLCTDELGVPTWVLKPLYDYLRRVGQRVSGYLRQAHGLMVPPLRCTVHAGEDFVHLLNGLRNTSEAVFRLGLCEGDRIGHGVALGVDAKAWAQNAGRVPIAREDRLLDLAWEWTCYSRHEVAFESGRLARIEEEIARLSQHVFGSPFTPFDIACLSDHMHDDWHLSRVAGFPGWRSSVSGPNTQNLLARFLTDPGLFRRGRQTDWIDPSNEAAALVNLQAGLRRRIASLALTVEINPTSNLLIANLGELLNHPLWRLNPPKPNGVDTPLSVCIGSDDPLTFCAGLPSEYMLLHDSLVLAGLGADAAHRWLDAARQAGLNARFTLKTHAPADAIRAVQGRCLDRTVVPPP